MRKRSALPSVDELLQRPARAETPAEPTPVAPETDAAQTPADTPTAGRALRKYTVPFRSVQLARLDRILARWAADKGVRVGAAEVMRLALDQVLARMEDEPDRVIRELVEQEQQETSGGVARKFGRLRGASEYLKQK